MLINFSYDLFSFQLSEKLCNDFSYLNPMESGTTSKFQKYTDELLNFLESKKDKWKEADFDMVLFQELKVRLEEAIEAHNQVTIKWKDLRTQQTLVRLNIESQSHS